MKLQIIHSVQENLFIIQTKRFLSSWETIGHYFFTDPHGNIHKVKGFPSFEQAEKWATDRYPEKPIKRSKEIDREIYYDS
jgi:hypothetical protein